MADNNFNLPQAYPGMNPLAIAQQSRASRASAAIARLTNPFVGATRPSSSAGFYSNLGMVTAQHSRTNLVSRSCHFKLPSSPNAFCGNPEFDRAIVTGRDYFTILKIEGTEITEVGSLRMNVTTQIPRRQVYPHEVKWGTALMRDTIAAAIPNGIICIYKDFKMERQLTEHQRQIHRLAFSPTDGRLLLSGSAEGSVRLWDLREKKSLKATFQGSPPNNIVRDVQFNPQNSLEFAVAYDDGTVQKWDVRRNDICERKVNAHSGPVLSLDWHPDGRHIATGGRDRIVKVWNFSTSERQDGRKRPVSSIATPTPIGGLTWRPPGTKNTTTEIATHPFRQESQIHIWDLKRPFIASRMIDSHNGVVAGILWKDEEILWSISRDNERSFAIHDLLFTKQPINDLTFNAIAISAQGEIAAAITPRNKQKIGHPHYEETTDEILYRGGRMQHGRSSSFKGSRPQSQLDLIGSITSPIEQLQQLALINVQFFDEKKFRTFAENWVTHVKSGESIAEALKKNAKVCLDAGYHSEWKTWQILAISMEQEERAAQKMLEKADAEAEAAARASAPGSVTDKRRTMLAKTISNPSTNTTPMARAVPDTPRYSVLKGDGRIHDNFLLPPAAFGTSLSSSTASTAGDGAYVSHVNKIDIPQPEISRAAHPHPQRANNSIEEEEEETASSRRSSSSGSYEEEIVYNVFPHSQAKPILIKRPHQRREHTAPAHNFAGISSGLRDFGSGSYDDKPLVRDSDDEGSPEFGRSHKDSHLGIVEGQNGKKNGILGGGGVGSGVGGSGKKGSYVPRVHLPGKFVWKERPEKIRPWSAERLIPKALELYTEAGDVQFCATLACLVARVIDLDYRQTDDWILTYIELLQARKLSTRAAYISKYSPTSTPRKNALNATYVLLSCGHCRKPLLNEHRKGYWLCNSCKKTQDGCVICRDVVTGQWVFCQACGHGGHLECLRSWYVGETMQKCPAVGCGHECIAMETG